MNEPYLNTVKYYRLAIKEFLPLLDSLKKKNSHDVEIQEKIDDLIEMYYDVANKIDKYNLNLDDPNRFYDGEPSEISIDLGERAIEYFSRLSLRLLESWKKRRGKIETKDYLTEKNEEELYRLKGLIWPLEAQFDNPSMLFYKYKDKGIVEFPGEKDAGVSKTKVPENMTNILFPKELIKKIPGDLKKLCDEFNFNYHNRKPNACVLSLRRILPLSIVRKFQKLEKEEEVMKDGEYLDTKGLVGKVEKILKNKRLYKEIVNYKLLLDSSQHSYTLKVSITDAEGAGIRVRLLLEDLFAETE